MNEQFTFNKRLLSDVLAKYSDTFVAFCELLNNSIQAGADKIEIQIEYAPTDKVTTSDLKRIVVRDNGVGVSKSEFRWKLLEVATKAKLGGQGIGRFAPLQMASQLHIQTVAYDKKEGSIFKAELLLNTNDWNTDSLDKASVSVNFEPISGTLESYYQVTITGFYGEDICREEKHRRVHKCFQEQFIGKTLFSLYPELIFQRKVTFIINNTILNPNDYIIGKIGESHETYTALDGKMYNIDYHFAQVASVGKHKMFLRVTNNNIQTVAQTFDYRIDLPEPNQWFIYIDSPFLDENADIFRDLSIYEMVPNADNLVNDIKSHVDKYFAQRYQQYRKFTEKLCADSYYPYKNRLASSASRSAVFHQLAFFVEEKHQLLSSNDDIRELVYALMDKALDSREFEFLLSKVIKLEDSIISRFKSLLDKADLDDVISFSEEVVRKQQFLDFMHKILYSEVAERVKERRELHKIVEKHLWIFGERFNGVMKLFSDKNLENILRQLR
jgi:hypothetical protein